MFFFVHQGTVNAALDNVNISLLSFNNIHIVHVLFFNPIALDGQYGPMTNTLKDNFSGVKYNTF